MPPNLEQSRQNGRADDDEQGGRAGAEAGDPQRATFLELFFDLVFVLALAQLSRGLAEDLGWSGAFRTLVLLGAMWWVWSSTAWLTDRTDPQRPVIQALVIATMVGSLVMAAAVPEAFGDTGLIFAGAYVAIQAESASPPRGRAVRPAKTL
jgi:low temperature requirement protein LtrA